MLASLELYSDLVSRMYVRSMYIPNAQNIHTPHVNTAIMKIRNLPNYGNDRCKSKSNPCMLHIRVSLSLDNPPCDRILLNIQ